MRVFEARRCSLQDRWDVKHLAELPWMESVQPLLQRLADVASRREELNDSGVPMGSVSFAGEVTRRRKSATASGRLHVAHPGDVVFSRIDIRNGAVGVVSASTGPLAFTNEFPIYDLSINKLLRPSFMQLLCRTTAFRSQVEARVVGHSGRRRLPAEVFEGLQVPVPSLAKQDQILGELAERRARAEERRAAARPLVSQAAAAVVEALEIQVPDFEPVRGGFVVSRSEFHGWSVRKGMAAHLGVVQELTSERKLRALGDPELAEIAYGIAKSPDNRPGEHARKYLRVANVQDGYLDLTHLKEIEVAPPLLPRFRLEPGDLLLCEGNSRELVGRPALWNGEVSDCVHQNHVLRVRVNREQLLPEFVFAYMHGPVGRWHFGQRAKQTTNLASINSTDVKELLIPVPDLGEQRELAELVTSARQQTDALVAEAVSIDVETDGWLAEMLGSRVIDPDEDEGLADDAE